MPTKKPKQYTMVVNFRTLEDAVNFASAIAPTGVSVYYADALDPEYGGHAPANSLVLRPDGHKPNDMRVA